MADYSILSNDTAFSHLAITCTIFFKIDFSASLKNLDYLFLHLVIKIFFMFYEYLFVKTDETHITGLIGIIVRVII